jgi:hypothetical protein
MASRADNMAANLSLANFAKATELKKRSGSRSAR